MNKFFGYIRVSTVKQGERGVSLQEQRSAIERFARRNELEICQWFDERVTAAKRGRPMFNEMLKLLRQGRAHGIVIHKIDRGARNLKDWSDLGELIDAGIEVHFANESLDLHSRGGRLSADIQAVVAADYIRNLREETRKGFYGRIKQGLYPLPAPIGYLNRGKGNPKELDPVQVPFIRSAFELYATGSYPLDALTEELERRGLRNRRGGRVSKNGLSRILNNPFYIGIIRLVSTGETFQGIHEPLIRKSLFDRVHAILYGKSTKGTGVHDFLYRRLIKCRHCGHVLVGERQKSHIYYRCHTKSCPTTSVREETISAAVDEALNGVALDEADRQIAGARITLMSAQAVADQAARAKALELQRSQIGERLAHLTDAYVETLIDRSLFEERKNALLQQRTEVQEKVGLLKHNEHFLADRANYLLELCGTAYFLHNLGLSEDKRVLVETISSNRIADGKNIEFTLAPPFREFAEQRRFSNGAPYRDRPRTLDRMVENLISWINANPATTFEAARDLLRDHSVMKDLGKEGKLAA